MSVAHPLRRYAGRLTAVTIVAALYALSRSPHLTADAARALASPYRFDSAVIAPPAVRPPLGRIRAVHPSAERIAPWISSVGAAAALSDLDLDGLPNDLCLVDTRNDEVSVMPAPGTGAQRYPAFVLDATAAERPDTAPMGCVPGDFNGDGWPDLLVYYWGRVPQLYLRIPGTPVPSASAYRAQPVIAPDEEWYTGAVAVADIDGDGHPDLVVGNYFQDGARILDPRAPGRVEMQDSMSRAVNGGRNRILLWSGATSGPRPEVRYRDASDALPAEVAGGWTLAVAAQDLDGDLLPELYFANDFGPDRLLHNQSRPGHPAFSLVEGRKGFTTPSSKVLGRDSFKGMGVDVVDLDGDGRLDLFVSNIAQAYALEESHFAFIATGEPLRGGGPPFVERSEALGLARSGWAWDAKAADLTNKGQPDIVQALGFVAGPPGAPDRWPELQELAMASDGLLKWLPAWFRLGPGDSLSGARDLAVFAAAASGVYHDVAAETGLLAPAGAWVARGIAIADVDGDGLMDMVVANQWAAPTYHHNVSRPAGRFIGLYAGLAEDPDRTGVAVHAGPPEAGTPFRPAVGLTALITLPDGRRRVAQVDGGSGHSGKRSPQLHVGLGDTAADAPVRVDLRWRDAAGRPQRHTLTLAPGWHTLVLGRPTQVAEDRP